jgi:hypothetical protein
MQKSVFTLQAEGHWFEPSSSHKKQSESETRERINSHFVFVPCSN